MEHKSTHYASLSLVDLDSGIIPDLGLFNLANPASCFPLIEIRWSFRLEYNEEMYFDRPALTYCDQHNVKSVKQISVGAYHVPKMERIGSYDYVCLCQIH